MAFKIKGSYFRDSVISFFHFILAARSREGASCWSCSQEGNCAFTGVGLVLKKTILSFVGLVFSKNSIFQT